MWNVVFEWKNKELWKMNPRLVGYFRQDSGSAEWPQQILSAYGLDGVLCALRALNNCYAGAWVVEDTLYLAADHIRSIPIYYSIGEETVYISDDAVYLAKKLGLPMDKWAKREFQNCGFTGNGRTLFDGVAGTQAGEFVAINLASHTVSSVQHFSELNSFETSGIEDEFDQIMVQAFQRIVESLNGQTVLLSLSGGHDSRAIATMLKRLHYENVICYSYGLPDSKEVKIAGMLAQALGYSWYPVYFTVEEQRNFRKSEQWKQVSLTVCHGDSYQSMIEAMVFDSLCDKLQGLENSVYMSGHIIEDAFLTMWDDMERGDDFEEVMFRNWYTMNRKTILSRYQCKSLFPIWHWRKDIPDQANNCAAIWRKELYPKLYCNSVRIAEYFGLGWRLPLMRRELAEYFLHLDKRATYDRDFWYRYTEKHIKPYSADIPYSDTVQESHHGQDGHRRWKEKVPVWFYSVVRKLYYAFSPQANFSKVPSAYERIRAVIFHGSVLPNYYLVNDILHNVEAEAEKTAE